MTDALGMNAHSYNAIRMCEEKGMPATCTEACEKTRIHTLKCCNTEQQDRRESEERERERVPRAIQRERKVSLRLLIAGGSDADRRSGTEPAPKKKTNWSKKETLQSFLQRAELLHPQNQVFQRVCRKNQQLVTSL